MKQINTTPKKREEEHQQRWADPLICYVINMLKNRLVGIVKSLTCHFNTCYSLRSKLIVVVFSKISEPTP
jgi:hypothetical protein